MLLVQDSLRRTVLFACAPRGIRSHQQSTPTLPTYAALPSALATAATTLS